MLRQFLDKVALLWFYSLNNELSWEEVEHAFLRDWNPYKKIANMIENKKKLKTYFKEMV